MVDWWERKKERANQRAARVRIWPPLSKIRCRASPSNALAGRDCRRATSALSDERPSGSHLSPPLAPILVKTIGRSWSAGGRRRVRRKPDCRGEVVCRSSRSLTRPARQGEHVYLIPCGKETRRTHRTRGGGRLRGAHHRIRGVRARVTQVFTTTFGQGPRARLRLWESTAFVCVL